VRISAFNSSGINLSGKRNVQTDSCLNSKQIDTVFISVWVSKGFWGGGGGVSGRRPKNLLVTIRKKLRLLPVPQAIEEENQPRSSYLLSPVARRRVLWSGMFAWMSASFPSFPPSFLALLKTSFLLFIRKLGFFALLPNPLCGASSHVIFVF